jgi:hypothetical protein
MNDAQYRDVLRAVRNRRQWIDLDDLADKMLARAAQGKNVVLSPGTAEYVARWIKFKHNADYRLTKIRIMIISPHETDHLPARRNQVPSPDAARSCQGHRCQG